MKGKLTQENFCRLLGISRTSLWRYGTGGGSEKSRAAKARIAVSPESWSEAARKLCERHMTYGYRRIWVLLRNEGYCVGRHKLRIWMRKSGFSQSPAIEDTGRTVGERPAEPNAPNLGWQIDATKIYTKADGWVWQTSILDIYDRRIVSYLVRKTCTSEDAMDAVCLALDRCFGDGKPDALSLIHDRGSQFTAWSFKQMLRQAKVNDVVTAVRHPQSCGRLERFHRTLKEECVWLSEWDSLAGVELAVGEYVYHYNYERIHSALDYQTPMKVHAAAVAGKTSLSAAA